MTFSKQFIEIMDAIGDRIGIAIDWTSENVAPYLQNLLERFIKYETFTSATWLTLGIVILITCVILIRKGFKCDIETGIVVLFATSIPILISLSMIIHQALDIIEVNTIPEKTIIEYIQYNVDL